MLWLIAIVRKVVMGSVPGLVTISGLVMTVQAAIAVSTGSLLFFLIQFPLGNLALAVLFARTAPTGTPLVAQLAAEIVGLHQTSLRHPSLNSFFQGVTWLWASLFFLMTVGFIGHDAHRAADAVPAAHDRRHGGHRGGRGRLLGAVVFCRDPQIRPCRSLRDRIARSA